MGRRSVENDAHIVNTSRELMTMSFRVSKYHDIEGAIRHSLEVGEILFHHQGNAEEVAAGILHDVVRDTRTTLDTIEISVGAKVCMFVRDCIDDPSWKGLPTLERKMMQAQRLKGCPSSSCRVKLADSISNMRRLISSPPAHWTDQQKEDWLEGTRLIYTTCEKKLYRRADRTLLDEFHGIYNNAKASLLTAQTA